MVINRMTFWISISLWYVLVLCSILRNVLVLLVLFKYIIKYVQIEKVKWNCTTGNENYIPMEMGNIALSGIYNAAVPAALTN